jgi:hypothetical protein
MQGHAPASVQLAFSLVAIGAGVAGDLLLWRLRPSAARPLALRAFAFLLPVVYFTTYLAVVVHFVGSGWTVHALTGSVVLSGIVGLLTSVVFADGR